MKLASSRAAILAALCGLLLLVLALLPPSQERQPALSVYSAEPAGGKALRLWLEALGYQVETLEGSPYRPPTGTTTLLILQPSRWFTALELDELEAWVRDGGTLVVAAEGFGPGLVARRFGIEPRALPAEVETARPAPGAGLDPAIEEVLIQSSEALTLVDGPGAALLVADDQVFAVTRPFGSGRVVLLASAAALSNRALRREANARFALALLERPEQGLVAIDELHHGYGESRPRAIPRLLLDERWGQAALYAGALVFGYLLLRGRRFGRARPAAVSRGRSLREYVSSVAGLYRAGGKRAFIAEHFRRSLRRTYTQQLGLPADASEAQLTARARATGRNPAAMLDALRALERGGQLGEAELIRLVRDGERALARSER